MDLLNATLYLIDGIGPFFKGNRRKEINWSKIDFSDLDADGPVPEARCLQIEHDFTLFCRRAAAIGYTAVTLDDVVHLVQHPCYPALLQKKIERYQTLYRRLFRIAQAVGMDVFITTDLLSVHPSIENQIGTGARAERLFARELCRTLFGEFPEVAGIIFRIGESDGVDVEGDFRSRLMIRTPADARKLLAELLPLFEENGKLLIFRTWTVGISRIGDLIWNPGTFRKVFDTCHSPNLIISMKYGESDFFRYLPLSRLFFETDHRKLVELQARREYEGFGRYPSFVGYDYEKFQRELAFARNIVGISVWCQTGGWSGFRALTLIEPEGIWNQINTFVTLRIFRDRMTADRAIQAFCNEVLNTVNWVDLKELLALSDQTVKNLLYIDEFATSSFFLRRVRIPPLITVYWKHILVNHLLRQVLRCYVSARYGRELVQSGYKSLEQIKTMRAIAEKLELPRQDFDFQYDTFHLIACSREYYFIPDPEEVLSRLGSMKQQYEQKWPEPRYAVQIDLRPVPLRRTHLWPILSLLLRRQRRYRFLDHLLGATLYAVPLALIRRITRRVFPRFASEQTMGIDSIFK